jgi:hypothetical protein
VECEERIDRDALRARDPILFYDEVYTDGSYFLLRFINLMYIISVKFNIQQHSCFTSTPLEIRNR